MYIGRVIGMKVNPLHNYCVQCCFVSPARMFMYCSGADDSHVS